MKRAPASFETFARDHLTAWAGHGA